MATEAKALQQPKSGIWATLIVGSGPAAYTAAIYAGRARLDTLVLQGEVAKVGGQLTTTTTIENYPGNAGIEGFELMQRMEAQAAENGAQLLPEKVVHVSHEDVAPGVKGFIVKTADKTYKAYTVIVASGAYAKRDAIPGTGDSEFWNKGVSACATCDGALFRNSKRIVVIGGGDTAMEEALFLTRFTEEVAVVHRRGELRASKVMAQRALTHPKIKFYLNQRVAQVLGSGKVEKVVLESTANGAKQELPARAVFFAIGHVPNSDFVKHLVKTDESGYVVPAHGTNETGVPGLYVAGDVADKEFRQAITAAGEGCKAALLATRFLEARNLTANL